MKKKLLLLFVLFTFIKGFSQGFNQPTSFNNVCDDSTNDGFATFYLGEISYEILMQQNAQNFVVTHHLSQGDAAENVNPLPNDYINVSNPQLIFARIFDITTSEVTIMAYNLTVNPAPTAFATSITICNENANSCVDLTQLEPSLSGGATSFQIAFFPTQLDAESGTNEIVTPYCYIPVSQMAAYRITNTVTNCYSIGTISFIYEDCGVSTCPMPTVTSTQVTQNSATIAWAGTGNETGFEVEINGVPITQATNPIVLTGLNCGTIYTVAIRANCVDNTYSQWNYYTFLTEYCPSPGQAQSYNQCVETGQQACFDLQQNDVNVIGTLNPLNYTVSYFMDQACTVLVPSPYCMTQGFQMLFSRVENNTNPSEYFISQFSLNVFDFNYIQTTLQPMVQCDDNNDQLVIFDLTTSQTQINSTNSLEYYTSSLDAQNQENVITNPSAFSVSTMNTSQTIIFIREIIDGGCDNIYTMPLTASSNCNNASNCIQANSLCNALGVPFNNTINSTVNEPGASYGCLFSHPNPTWFYLPVSQAGQINLVVQQNTSIDFLGTMRDVDYIVYGPFSSPTTPCYSQLTQNAIVSCSYSASSIEYPVIPNALPGQYYLIMVTNFSNQPGYIKIEELGSSSAEIDCTGMRLNAFLDSNNNGVQDNGENNFPLGQFHYEINNNGAVHDITSPTGIYNIYDINPNNSYDLSYTINSSYASMYSISTANFNDVNVIVGGGMITYNFPVTIVQSYNDLSVAIVPSNAPRPGFTYLNRIVYSNMGNQTISSGTITFTKDNAVSVSAVTPSSVINTTTGFTYNFTNLLPFETRTVDVSLQVPTIPTVEAGQYLTNSVSIEPTAGDVVLENNQNSVTQMVVNAYDPNDKMEARGEQILISSFTQNDYLYYTIRFENTGNASAINVRVNDVLNDQLDASTVRMVSASHPYILDQVDNNLTWRFDNIQLPVSIANTSIGKGYITFKVKPMSGYAVGDIIPNSAAIYFDYNPAIITNTYTTEFVNQLSIGENELSNFILSPNPAKESFTISLADNSHAIKDVFVYDVAGKIVLTKKAINFYTTSVDVSNISSGMYFVEIVSDQKNKVTKKLIIK
ncbi:MAG: T9SS type A sorting domain-containing protein [Flavobacteriaceae bacterium]